jgi:molybdenum cofactor cytidylyltransferase
MPYASLATGVLLAAGFGSRFDPEGLQNKLLARMPDGTPVAHESAHRLLRVVTRVLAVVRPGSDALARLLNDAGCDVVFAAGANRGMGASLAAGIEASDDAEGWIVALADMPRIATTTIEAVARALVEHRDALLALDGDTGAKSLLMSQRVTRVDVRDPGILRDVDTPEDLREV